MSSFVAILAIAQFNGPRHLVLTFTAPKTESQ